MPPDEIKQRLTVDDQATDKIKKVAEATRDISKETKNTGEQADIASNKTGRLTESFSSLRDAIGFVTARFSAFIAAGVAVIAFLKRVADQARESAEAIADLGEKVSGLAANVGGERADRIVDAITDIAKEKGIGKEGRQSVLEAITAETDVNAGLTNYQIIERGLGFAELERATGIGGSEAQNVSQSLRNRIGLTFDQSIDRASTLLNGGFTPNTLAALLEKTGEVGGEEFLNLAYAARGGLDLSKAEFDPLLSALTRQDARGKLAPELRAAGVTADQSLTQRIAAISLASASGSIDQAALRAAIGGAQNERLFNPLARAIPTLPGATEALATGTVEDQIANLLASEYVAAAERARTRQLRTQIAEEQSGLGGAGEKIDEAITRLSEQGGGDPYLGAARLAGRVITADVLGEQGRRASPPIVSPFSIGWDFSQSLPSQRQQINVTNNNISEAYINVLPGGESPQSALTGRPSEGLQ